MECIYALFNISYPTIIALFPHIKILSRGIIDLMS